MIVLSVMRPCTYQLLCGRYFLKVWSQNFVNPMDRSILSERPSVGWYKLVDNMTIGAACNGRENKLRPPRVTINNLFWYQPIKIHIVAVATSRPYTGSYCQTPRSRKDCGCVTVVLKHNSRCTVSVEHNKNV
jgi:hypothetical protein